MRWRALVGQCPVTKGPKSSGCVVHLRHGQNQWRASLSFSQDQIEFRGGEHLNVQCALIGASQVINRQQRDGKSSCIIARCVELMIHCWSHIEFAREQNVTEIPDVCIAVCTGVVECGQ